MKIKDLAEPGEADGASPLPPGYHAQQNQAENPPRGVSRRDAFGVAAAALALGVTAQPEAAAASAVEAQRPPWSPDAIRERIALLVKTLSLTTAGFPNPTTEKEAAAALTMTDAEIEALAAPLAFASAGASLSIGFSVAT
jgi:hypothetical protein